MISRHSLALTLFASAIVFGYAYCLDLFQALQVHFRQEPYNFTTMQFNLMYFFTYLPIFLFNIPIGTLIDRTSIKNSLFVLTIASFISQFICTIMLQTQIQGYIFIMYFSRCFFGVAGQGIFTVQAAIITKCCRDHFQIVMSVALSLPFVFDSLNSLVTTRVYDTTEMMIYPWIIGIFVCLISIVSGLIIYFWFIRQKTSLNHESLLQQFSQNQGSKQIKASQEQLQESGFNLRQLRSLSFTFWILIISSFFTEMSLGSFTDNLNDLLVKRFNIPYTHAGSLLIIPYLCLTIFSIIFSLLLSKYPKIRRTTYIISSFLYFIGQILLYLLPQTQDPTWIYYLVICFFCTTMSLSFSIYYTSILAAIPCVVPASSVGTAFGVIGCIVGLSQCTTPFMNIGIINSNDDLSISYKSLNLAYIFVSLIPVCLSLYVKFGPFEEVDEKLQQK